MYYGPGTSGWGMTFMIIGNLVLWGLLIFGAVLVARYVWPAQTASSSQAELSPQQSGTTIRPRRDQRAGIPASLAGLVRRFGRNSQLARLQPQSVTSDPGVGQ